MASNDVMLTTYDNPYNPFTDFESWFKMDTLLGHNTCGLLAEYANVSSIFSDEVNDAYTLQAMNDICLLEPTLYVIVDAEQAERMTA